MKKKNVKKLTLKKVTIQTLTNDHQRLLKGGYDFITDPNLLTLKCPINTLLCPPPPTIGICGSNAISICICPTIEYSCYGSVQVCCA